MFRDMLDGICNGSPRALVQRRWAHAVIYILNKEMDEGPKARDEMYKERVMMQSILVSYRSVKDSNKKSRAKSNVESKGEN